MISMAEQIFDLIDGMLRECVVDLQFEPPLTIVVVGKSGSLFALRVKRYDHAGGEFSDAVGLFGVGNTEELPLHGLVCDSTGRAQPINIREDPAH